jgi:hypothetical protein
MDVPDTGPDAIAIVRCKCLFTANSIFHLASVLSAARRTLVRETFLRRTVTDVESSEVAKAEFHTHMASQGLGLHHDLPPMDRGDQSILEAETENAETIPAETMVDTDISTDENGASSEGLCTSKQMEVCEKFYASFDSARLRSIKPSKVSKTLSRSRQRTCF